MDAKYQNYNTSLISKLTIMIVKQNLNIINEISKSN